MSKLKDDTIRKLVALVDELRQPFNNSSRHDLYLKATDMLNQLEARGSIPDALDLFGEDKCKICGDHIGYGHVAFHLGDCGKHGS